MSIVSAEITLIYLNIKYVFFKTFLTMVLLFSSS